MNKTFSKLKNIFHVVTKYLRQNSHNNIRVIINSHKKEFLLYKRAFFFIRARIFRRVFIEF